MSKEIKIGILTIVGIGLLFWGYNFLKGQNLFNSTSTYYVQYDNINKLQISAPVFINGYQVGSVQTIDIDPKDMQNIVLGLSVDPKIKLPQNTVAQLVADGVMGDMAIILKYTGVCNDDCVTSGSYLKSEKVGFLHSLIAPGDLDAYMKNIKMGIGGIVDTVNHIVRSEEYQDSELGELTKSIKNTITNLESTTSNLNLLIQSNAKAMNQLLTNLSSITSGIDDNQSSLTNSIKNIETLTHQFANAKLDSTIIDTRSTIKTMGDAGQQLNGTLNSLNQTTDKLTTLLTGINTGEGTVGKLIKDEQLYNNLQSATKNLDLLLQDFRLNPKRYVNVSVFGKKQEDYTVPEMDPAQ
ncbi:MlaD family protein [Membranihabitans marinus]|uniref:MlaD family protein n=1 Tax=Membranihabitans marinus TaxID=1227546 RepID=UPI001F357C3A|nr:MlaD family protein [Membranihabitans marinus]